MRLLNEHPKMKKKKKKYGDVGLTVQTTQWVSSDYWLPGTTPVQLNLGDATWEFKKLKRHKAFIIYH